MKNTLPVYHAIVAGDMSSATLTSPVTTIEYLDNIAVQFQWTGVPVGVCAVQGSMDYVPGIGGTVISAGNWTTITLTPSPTQPAGSSGGMLINLNQLSFPYIRLLYTKTSGTGTLDAYLGGKSI